MLLQRASRNALDAVFSSAATQAAYACPAAFIKEQMRENTAALPEAKNLVACRLLSRTCGRQT